MDRTNPPKVDLTFREKVFEGMVRYHFRQLQEELTVYGIRPDEVKLLKPIVEAEFKLLRCVDEVIINP